MRITRRGVDIFLLSETHSLSPSLPPSLYLYTSLSLSSALAIHPCLLAPFFMRSGRSSVSASLYVRRHLNARSPMPSCGGNGRRYCPCAPLLRTPACLCECEHGRPTVIACESMRQCFTHTHTRTMRAHSQSHTHSHTPLVIPTNYESEQRSSLLPMRALSRERERWIEKDGGRRKME